jgi:putative endonuclease
MTTTRRKKTCRYQDCEQTIPPWYTFCYDHNQEKESGKIDVCPSPECGKGKDAKYELCRDCNAKSKGGNTAPPRKYQPESNPIWDEADQDGDAFFVYILKLEGGKFYAGHTRELRERLDEHRDGKTKSTAGKNPQLVWFYPFPTRAEAADTEALLKETIDKNEREIRRMIIEFHDLIELVVVEKPSASVKDSPQRAPQRPVRYGSRR